MFVVEGLELLLRLDQLGPLLFQEPPFALLILTVLSSGAQRLGQVFHPLLEVADYDVFFVTHISKLEKSF